MQSHFESLLQWLLVYKINIILSIVIIVIYSILRRVVIPKIENYIERDHLKYETLKNAVFSVNLFSGLITFALILFIWGFDLKGLLALSTGLVAITGVALFASWSLLSNVTAFFLLLAHHSYRRGNFVRIIEQDNFIEGYISEINLFNTKLISENREVIIYPNNLLIARPIMINPKSRYAPIGKIQEFINISDDLTE